MSIEGIEPTPNRDRASEPDPDGFVHLAPIVNVKTCPLCWDDQVEGCLACRGVGEWPLHVAPDSSTVSTFADVLFLASSAANHGSWPEPGGPSMQSNWFVEAVRWFSRMRSIVDAERQKELEERFQRAGRKR